MELLDVKNLTFSYPGCKDRALDGVSLTVKKGEFILLCGKSGSGKTTLLSHLKPAMSPHGVKTGVIYYDGVDISTLSEEMQARKIGYVMQNPNRQTVTDKVWHEIAFGPENLGTEPGLMHRQVADISYFFGIDKWFDRDINTLSGGQKQLVNLAAVMAMSPDLLLLDEPTSQLDPIAAEEFMNAIYRINSELGTTVILSEHRIDNVYKYADRVIFMDGGKILCDCPSTEFVSRADGDKTDFLPVPSKIYLSCGGAGNVPITVKDGRLWLEKSLKSRIKYKTEIKKPSEYAAIIKNISFRYSKSSDDILKSCTFSIPSGCIFSIVGGNGQGKSTLLKVISGIHKRYEGKIDLGNHRAVYLPQEAVLLFSKDTVEDELKQMSDSRRDISRIAKLCHIENLYRKHPYDISAGQQQCVALAKILLVEGADILLLDEVTKGIDPIFKKNFARILKNLCAAGKTIVLVSHDLEFCAEYSDYVGMFFDKTVSGIDSPQAFFSQNNFYTTSAARISRNIIDGAVTAKEIINICKTN